MLFERDGTKWTLRPAVVDIIRRFNESSKPLPSTYEEVLRPHLLMNPRQDKVMISSRAGVHYRMGTCPHCDQTLLFTTVCGPIAFTSCCHTPKVYGDEVAACTQQSCPQFRCALCLDGKHACQYKDLEKTPSQFTVPVEEELSDRLGLGDPMSLVTREDDCALEIIREAILSSAEASLNVELQWCYWEPFLESARQVLAPVPPLVSCESLHGALQKSSGRRSMAYLKKLVNPAKPPTKARQHQSKFRKGKQVTKTPLATCWTMNQGFSASSTSGGVDETESLSIASSMKFCAPGSSLALYRITPSERFRAKVHRLSFGLKDIVSTPD